MDEELNNPKNPDPRELDALQRDAEDVLQIDEQQSPAPVAMPDFPAAAGQPDPMRAVDLPDFTDDVQPGDVQAPEIPDELLRPALDATPNIPSTPPRKKLSAAQKRKGMVEPPKAPPLPDPPPDAGQPRQQPAEPIAPNELHQAAKDAHAIDADGVVDFNRAPAVPPHPEAADADKQEEIQAEKAVQDKIIGIETTRTQILQDFAARLGRIEEAQRRILNGQMRRRA